MTLGPPRPDPVDVLVVGAGPAGTTAAIAARRYRPGWRVVLVDAQAFPRDKACGDAIAVHAFDELARVGVTGVTDGADPVDRLRLAAPDGTTVTGTAARPNRVIPRAVFDARLVDKALAAGAHLRRHRVRRLRVVGDRVVVDDRWAARWVVGADGANSVVRRALSVPTPAHRHRAIAVRAYASDGVHRAAVDRDPARTQRIDMVAAGWPAYAWSFPVGGGRVNAGFGMRVDGARALGRPPRDALIDGLRMVADPPFDRIALHPLPLSTGRAFPGRGRVLLVGDAAGLINPLTGEGIFYAVASGRLAARAIADADAGDTADAATRHRALLHRRFGAHFRTTDGLARLLDAQSLAPVAVAAAAEPGPFADLVEIGLGEGRVTGRLAMAAARTGWRDRGRLAASLGRR